MLEIENENLTTEVEISSEQPEGNILKQVTNYSGMIIASSKELAIQIKDTRAVIGNIDVKVQLVIEQLTAEINELRSEILLFRSIAKNIPESIENELKTIIPKISSEVQQLYQSELIEINKRIEDSNANLISIVNQASLSIEQLDKKSRSSLNSLINESKKLDYTYFKRLSLNMGIAIIISVIAGATASYFMVKRFPTRVNVNDANNITIDRSNVNILKKTDKIK